MNKKNKILIFIIIVVAILPFGYKQYIDQTIVSHIKALSDKGFFVSKDKDQGDYLSTVQSYKLVVSNPDTIYDEFLSKLFNSSQKVLIKKALSSLNGSEITVDLNILNFPTFHQNAITIYLTSLPSSLSLKANKDLFLQQISRFLQEKSLGESISINALGKITSITAKNIDKQFDIKKGSLKVRLKDYVTDISRFDLYHDNYAFKVANKLFDFKVTPNANHKFALGYKNLKCSVDRKNIYNYKLFCNLDELYLDSKKYKKQTLKLNTVFSSYASSLRQNSMDYLFKYKIKDINFGLTSRYQKDRVLVKDFVYTGSITGINKEIIDAISKMSYSNSKNHFGQQYRDIIQQIIHDGFVFNATKLSTSSIKIITKSKTISIGTIKTSMKLKLLKNNTNFFNKAKLAKILKYLVIDANIQMKKRDYEFLDNLDKRKRINIGRFVKYQGDNVVFDIKFIDSKLTINGQQVF